MGVDVRRLLTRADISIELGRLVIRPFSGRPVPPDWQQKYSEALVRELLSELGAEAYQYSSYTTGNYDSGRLPGITLQFQSVSTHDDFYAIFNANLSRSRSIDAGKAGKALPKGHFRVSARSGFYRFWLSTGLTVPRRLAALHDYMGNLRGILFVADMKDGQPNRMNATSLRPLSVSFQHVRRTFEPDSARTIFGQLPDNARTRVPDKDLAQTLAAHGLQPISTTGQKGRDKAVISECVDTEVCPPSVQQKRPEDQSCEEWLADFSSPVTYTQTEGSQMRGST